jgi:hypothetical protein
MPSQALARWQGTRLPALLAVEGQCAATAGTPPLADENLRGLVLLLLSAHFQGFCRDLYTECVQAVIAATAPGMRLVVQGQCLAHRQLEARNPSLEVLAADFNRFGVDVSAALQLTPANQPRVTHLNMLVRWRNYAAHANPLPPSGGGVLSLAAVGVWRQSCDGLAAEIDQVLYNVLTTAAGAAPW